MWARARTFLTSPPWRLGFDAALEARYQAHFAIAQARTGCLVGLIALIAFNATVTEELLVGEFAPLGQSRALLTSHALVTLPVLTFILILRLRPNPRLREALMAGGYMLVTFGAIALNGAMTGEAAARDAFTDALIPIACNFALPISFPTALLGSIVCVAGLTANCLARADFSAAALGSLIPLYLVGAAVTLIANFRFERAERRNYLSFLLESERGREMQRVNAALAHLSRTDFLTGIANRRAFDERFAGAVEVGCRRSSPLAALMVDIDHFKAYNDLYGHLAGDKCLKKIADAMAGVVKDAGGFVGRYGGEEFAAYLPETSYEGARSVAERLRAAVAALKLPHATGAEAGYVTVSVGAASLNPERREAAADLLRRADDALYRAKRNGRNRAEFDLGAGEYGPQPRSAS